MEDFFREKICWAETIKIHYDGTRNFPRFAHLHSYFLDKTCFFMVGKNLDFLISILNSKLMEYYIKSSVMTLGAASLGLQKSYIERLPIINPDDIHKRHILEFYQDLEKATSNNAYLSLIEEKIDDFVFNLYDFTDSQSALLLKKTINYLRC